MPSTPELQHTVAKTAGFSGTALHTGEKVTLKLHPAPADHGIKFRRKDLQDEPTIDAKIENLKTVERATTIGEGPIRVHTVEHVLATLWAMGVDNAVVEMDANEPPIGDGSAQSYVDLIRKAGVTPQEEPRKFFDVRETMHVESKTGALLVLLPDDKFRISCTQAGPNNRFAQFLSVEVMPAVFERNSSGTKFLISSATSLWSDDAFAATWWQSNLVMRAMRTWPVQSPANRGAEAPWPRLGPCPAATAGSIRTR